MSALDNIPFEAHFVAGQSGNLFGLFFPAVGEVQGQLLCIPPFSEESNRSRVMMSMAARALAAKGYATLILDPYGTGDSEGDFEQARWEGWRQDVGTGVEWLRQRGEFPTLWGVRSGAMLVTEYAQQCSHEVKRLLFWQPVQNGKQMMTQYLRLRVANLAENSASPVTTKELRQRLEAGETLEVGGYYIAPQLAAGIDQAALATASLTPGMTVDWLESVDPGKCEISMASQKVCESWREQGVTVRSLPFTGPAFWQLHERFLAPDLIEQTVRAVSHG